MKFSILDTTELKKRTIHFFLYLTVIIYIYTGTDVIEIYWMAFMSLRKQIRHDRDENNFPLIPELTSLKFIGPSSCRSENQFVMIKIKKKSTSTGTDVIEIYRIVFLSFRKQIRHDKDENNFYLYFLQNTDQHYRYHIWSLSPHAIQI